MTVPEGAATARQWLARQVDELGGLFNAGVRSPVFKQWRQNTLTCIQRIWPGDSAKSERFKRIPFSPPMGRPGEREVREYFAKGCGEALSVLKDYLAEIETTGVPEQSGATTAAPLGTDPDAFPTVDLSGTPPPRAVKPAMKIIKPRLKDLLGFTKDLLGFAEVPELEPPARPQQAAPAPRVGPPPVPQAAPRPAPVVPDEFMAHPTAEAMGMPALPKVEHHEFFATPEPGVLDLPAPDPAHAHLSGPPSTAPQSRVVVTGAAPAEIPAPPPRPPSPVLRAAEGAAMAREITPQADSGIEIEPEGLALERVTEELLRTSSHLNLVPRPKSGVLEGMTREGRSPVALAVAALASEVEALGVPDGQRARTRAALLDLSRRLDDPDLPWETLQEAMAFLMQNPELGRRVVPLLLPYLDRAA